MKNYGGKKFHASSPSSGLSSFWVRFGSGLVRTLSGLGLVRVRFGFGVGVGLRVPRALRAPAFREGSCSSLKFPTGGFPHLSRDISTVLLVEFTTAYEARAVWGRFFAEP